MAKFISFIIAVGFLMLFDKLIFSGFGFNVSYASLFTVLTLNMLMSFGLTALLLNFDDSKKGDK